MLSTRASCFLDFLFFVSTFRLTIYFGCYFRRRQDKTRQNKNQTRPHKSRTPRKRDSSAPHHAHTHTHTHPAGNKDRNRNRNTQHINDRSNNLPHSTQAINYTQKNGSFNTRTLPTPPLLHNHASARPTLQTQSHTRNRLRRLGARATVCAAASGDEEGKG